MCFFNENRAFRQADHRYHRIQSLGTFLFVTLAFGVTFFIAGIPVYLSFVSGTIVAAAIINEVIAVILAKTAFWKAGEIPEQ